MQNCVFMRSAPAACVAAFACARRPLHIRSELQGDSYIRTAFCEAAEVQRRELAASQGRTLFLLARRSAHARALARWLRPCAARVAASSFLRA